MKKRTPGAIIALTALALSLGLVGSASAAPVPGQSYQGGAFGTSVNVANKVTSISSQINLPCAPAAPPGYEHSLTAATVNVPGLLSTGALDTSVSTGPSSGPPLSSSSGDINQISALAGLVTATEVKAVSTTSVDSTGYHLSSAGSELVGLVIDGRPITVFPAPNTTIDLPGVGKVVLNEQTASTTPTRASLTVNMIHITVTIAQPGIPAGTQITLGHASSGLTQQVNPEPTLRGTALTASAHVGTVFNTAEEATLGFCGTTNGKTLTRSIVSTNIPGIESSDTGVNTVSGTVGATTSTSHSTANVQHLSLLSGLVTADAIESVADASLTGNTVGLREDGSTFTNLVVNGQPISANVPPNTKVSVGNVTIWLNHVVKKSDGITVKMIEIAVKGANNLGLPIGSDITVASAFAAVYPHS